MRPIFTIHAGEFVFGEEFAKRFKESDLWIPTKDKGIDFLVTKPNDKHPVAVQVKMSRDYRKDVAATLYDKALIAGGFFSFSKAKIAHSPADVWSLILVSRERRMAPLFINISPKHLLDRLQATYGDQDPYVLYPWVLKPPATEGKQQSKIFCVEGWNLKKQEREDVVRGRYQLGQRDWTDHLDDWSMF